MANFKIIKQLCKQKKISIQELAEKLGVTDAAIYDIIKRNSTSIPTMENIAKILDVSPAIFFTEEIPGIVNEPTQPYGNNYKDELIETQRKLIAELEKNKVPSPNVTKQATDDKVHK